MENKIKANLTWAETRNKSKLELYIEDISQIVEDLKNWIDINSCRCSYFSLRWTVEMAIRWEIWEKFKLIETWNKEIIEKLAIKILNNSL